MYTCYDFMHPQTETMSKYLEALKSFDDKVCKLNLIVRVYTNYICMIAAVNMKGTAHGV